MTDLTPLKDLTELDFLNLWKCARVTNLRPLKRLEKLKTLDLTGCTGISKFNVLEVFEKLSVLDLTGCTAVMELDFVEHLVKLTELSLEDCSRINDIGPLENLTQLTHLNMEGCMCVTDFKPLESLSHLKEVDLWGCAGLSQVTVLRLARVWEKGGFPNLVTLWLDSTNVSLPENLVHRRSAPEIFRHLLTAKDKLAETKVMIVGAGRVGKSHLLQRLFAEHPSKRLYYNPVLEATHDINIQQVPRTNGEPSFRVWDFGGQDYLHSSHRFFLGADHAVYVLVLDATKDAHQNRLNYWLRFISHHGRGARVRSGQRESAPVIVVLNKCDALALAESPDGREWGCEFRANNEHLMASLERAEKAHWLGAHVVGKPISGLGIFDVRKGLKDEILKTYPGDLRCGWPETVQRHESALVEIEDRLKDAISLAPGADNKYEPGFHALKDWLDKEFTPRSAGGKPVKMLKTTGKRWRRATEGEVWEPWLATLRSLGVIHWVGDDPDLCLRYAIIANTVFNPTWVKGPVYRLLQPVAGQRKPGILSESQFRKRLGRMPQKYADAVRALVRAYHLAYDVLDPRKGLESGEILVPDLLDPWFGDEEVWANWRVKRIVIPFLSDRCLLRFIGKHYHEIRQPHVECRRNRIILTGTNSLQRILIESSVDSEEGARPAPPEPYLRIAMTGYERGECELVMDSLVRELAQILRSERLLRETQDPQVQDEWWPQLERKRGDELETLERFIRQNEKGKWLSETEAHELYKMMKSSECTLQSFRRYRRTGLHSNRSYAGPQVGDYGATEKRYVWKRSSKGYEYLQKTFDEPYPVSTQNC